MKNKLDKDTQEAIGRQLKYVRGAYSMSAYDVANNLGCSAGYIYSIEKGAVDLLASGVGIRYVFWMEAVAKSTIAIDSIDYIYLEQFADFIRQGGVG